MSICLSVCPSVCPSLRLSVNISLVNTITLQILVALGPNLYHGCISGVSWLSSKMDDLDFFQGRGSPFNNDNLHFLLVNTITQQILVALGPKLYHGCISGVSWSSSTMDDLDFFSRSWEFPKGAKVYPASRRRSNKRVGLKGQLAPYCVPWLKNSIMAYKRLSTSLGSKTLNNTSSLGLGGTKI